MEIKRLFDAIVRKSWLIVLLMVVGGLVTGYVSFYFTAPTYEAETTIYAMYRNKVGSTGSQDITASRQLVSDYSQIIDSSTITSLAILELKDFNLTEEDLTKMVSVSLQKDSSVLAIRAVSTDPKVAAAVANAMGRAFTGKMRQLINNDSISILDAAKIPEHPIPVGHTKNILVGVLAGMAAAFGIIYLSELFDTTIRAAEDVEYGLKLRVVGIIPAHNIR